MVSRRLVTDEDIGRNQPDALIAFQVNGDRMSNNPYQPAKAPGGAAPSGEKPKNWLVESILSLVCCGGLIAIPAIIYATQVDSKFNSGDYAGAVEASDNAKKWLFIAVGVGVVCQGLGGLLYIVLIVASAAGA